MNKSDSKSSVESLISQQVNIDKMQFGIMPGRGTMAMSRRITLC